MNYETLNYYNENAKEYFETTKNLKTTEIYKEFLSMVKSSGKVLDVVQEGIVYILKMLGLMLLLLMVL